MKTHELNKWKAFLNKIDNLIEEIPDDPVDNEVFDKLFGLKEKINALMVPHIKLTKEEQFLYGNGKKVEALKALRARTGITFKASKQVTGYDTQPDRVTY